MICKNCGTENPNDSKNCSQCGTALPKDAAKQAELDAFQQKLQMKAKKKIKWWQILLIILAAFILLGVIFGTGDDAEPAGASSTQSASSAKAESAPKDEKSVYTAGETLDAKGLKVTMQKAEKWTSNNQFITPEDNNMFIRVYFVIENQSGADKLIGSFDFDCYADGAQMDNSWYGDQQLSFDTISDGRRIEGYIYYEVPENAKEIEIEYETSWWTSKKAIFKVEL